MSDREEFLAGERPTDVLLYFAEEAVSGVDKLAELGERVEDGAVIVVDGERGRSAFQRAVGVDAMAFAKRAMEAEGEVDPDCTGGVCPATEDDPDDPHTAQYAFAFAEEQNEEVGGLYGEGDVIHAYVNCSCGQAYSEKWVVGEK